MTATATGPVVAVVPAFNEEGAVGDVVRDLLALVERMVVVVVDDASTDRTGQAARAAGALVLRPPFNLGIGGAVQLGFRYARSLGAAVAVQVDGDGQHPAAEVPRVVAPILAGDADVCIGSRFLEQGGDRSTAARRLGIRWLAALVRLRCGRSFSDPTSGLRAYGRAPLDWLAEHYPDDYPEPQVLAPLVRRGLRVTEVPVKMRARAGGQSSIRGLAPVFYMAKVSTAVLLGSMK
jgi:glycosyltransferase involved in cell wall biosynthesis